MDFSPLLLSIRQLCILIFHILSFMRTRTAGYFSLLFSTHILARSVWKLQLFLLGLLSIITSFIKLPCPGAQQRRQSRLETKLPLFNMCCSTHLINLPIYDIQVWPYLAHLDIVIIKAPGSHESSQDYSCHIIMWLCEMAVTESPCCGLKMLVVKVKMITVGITVGGVRADQMPSLVECACGCFWNFEKE